MKLFGTPSWPRRYVALGRYVADDSLSARHPERFNMVVFIYLGATLSLALFETLLSFDIAYLVALAAATATSLVVILIVLPYLAARRIFQNDAYDPSLEVDPWTFDDYSTEIDRQRKLHRTAYCWRWLLGWPKIAFYNGWSRAGWYLMKGDATSRRCSTIGPFNSRRQALSYLKRRPAFYFAAYDTVLLWKEPPRNQACDHREFGRPWYRVPPPSAPITASEAVVHA